MQNKILINSSITSYLLKMDKTKKTRFYEKIEFLENGILDAGVKVKKLKGISGKVIFEARLTRGDRILFTMGKHGGQTALYVWGIVKHDDISAGAQKIIPTNAPFLNFEPVEHEEYKELILDDLKEEYYSQEALEEKSLSDYGPQKWFILENTEWERIFKNSDPDCFEFYLYLTGEQQEVLKHSPPILLSGTAGSGKTTISVYYLFHRDYLEKNKLYVTYSPYLKEFSKKIYNGLVKDRSFDKNISKPHFFCFSELLSDIFKKHNSDFFQDTWVGLKEFETIFKNHRLYKKFDTELVWEEIRSIIKGALPQLSSNILKTLISRYINKSLHAGDILILQDYCAQLKNFELIHKIERIIEKKSKYPSFDHFLSSFTMEYSHDFEQNRIILSEIHKLVEKKGHAFFNLMLTLSEYEHLGKKRAPNFLYDRESIYSIADYYQNELTAKGLKDEIDVCREAIKLMETGKSGHYYDLIVCDEVQDFTDIQLSLLFKLSGNYRNMLLAGDPRQIINPSGFRWEEIKSKFYERNIKVPEVFQLRLNFRCLGSIVKLGNTLLDLKKELVGITGFETHEDWKFNGRPPVVIRNIEENELCAQLKMESAGQIILVRDKKEQKYVKKHLGTELVFTIHQAKGLEFNTILLWKFTKNKKSTELWRKIYNEHHLDTSHYPHIKHELNLLYVAVTRARNTLIIYDGKTMSDIWQIDRLKKEIYIADDINTLNELWQHISTPEEWESQGDYFFEREYYKPAYECYKNANHNNKMDMAYAYILLMEKKYSQAGSLFMKNGMTDKAAHSFELAEEYEKAVKLWQKCKNKKRAAYCRIKDLEQKREFDKAAAEWIKIKKPDQAVKNWEKSCNYPLLADHYSKSKNFKKAADFFEKAGDFPGAALCYKKAKNLKKAADLFFRAKDYKSASLLFKKQKNTEYLIKCYKELKEHLPLVTYFEGIKDYAQAVFYCKEFAQLSKENMTFIKAEAKKYISKNPLKAAVRLSAAGRYKQSGLLFMKKKYYSLAIDNLKQTENHEDLATCYQAQKEFYEAACEIEKTSAGDKWKKSFSLLQKFIYQNNEYNRLSAKKLFNEAEEYKNESKLMPALVRYKAINFPEGLKEVYMKLDLDEEALQYFMKTDTGDYEITQEYINEKKKLNLSPPFIEYIMQKAYLNVLNYKENMETIICIKIVRNYIRATKDEESILILKKRINKLIPLLATEYAITEMIYDILLEIKSYNLIYDFFHRLYYRNKKNKQEAKELLERCRELAETNNDTNLLACYYSIHDLVTYNNILETLEITNDNYALFEWSNSHFDRIIEFHLQRKDYNTAISIASLHNEDSIVASIYEKTGNYTEAGKYFLKNKDYNKAMEFFQKAKDIPNIARTYEKMKELKKALATWEKLGRPRDIGRVKKKLITMNVPVNNPDYDQKDLF